MSTTLPPLAELLRPTSLDKYIGQKHLVGNGAILRKMIEGGNIPSMIFWGPPGVGKTTLAMIISRQLDVPFYTLSAVSSGVKDVRDVIDKARVSGHCVLFIDEIHRFNKSQQDSLLAAVEKGIITLIGATTENPSFEVITPLLSRCQVYVLKALELNDLKTLTQYAVDWYSKNDFSIVVDEFEAMFQISGGDARKLLNILELSVISAYQEGKTLHIDNALVQHVIQNKLAIYDKGGEQHYDIISAFIKSMRGSDPNGAVYWLARMIEGGEDPKFIARRMVIFSSEDIGNANPNALLLANACFQAIANIGMPEGRIILSQTAVYLASSPKSNASYMAIAAAMEKAHESGNLPVPLHLRNAPTKLMKDLGYGKEYKYAHEYEGNFTNQEFLPDNLSGTKFYNPGNNSRENDIRQRLKHWWGEKYDY
ncbi:MAG: replication-associated recombination protein A [Bacteroidales bacterium]|nr:replication-associated recombination protein A [Bacteroidales bacterium]